jgi:DNA-binding MarR family transcriptional regulator
MSSRADAQPEDRPPEALARRLGYALKHVQFRLAEISGPALAPLGIDGRELGVLVVLAEGEPLSQQQAARRLGIDRTTMVAMIDGLEGKRLVARRLDARDRRRNIVEPTPAGRETLREAMAITDDVERRFLAPLGEPGAQRFTDALVRLLGHP